MKKIEIIVEKTKTGYSAFAEKLPVYTIGNTLEELKTNTIEAINLYLEFNGSARIIERALKIMPAR